MIRKRAAQVKRVLGEEAPVLLKGITAPPEFTLRDEANAICAYAFRNGPLVHQPPNLAPPSRRLMRLRQGTIEELPQHSPGVNLVVLAPIRLGWQTELVGQRRHPQD